MATYVFIVNSVSDWSGREGLRNRDTLHSSLSMASCRQDHLPRQTRVDQTRFRCPIRERGACHALGVYRGIEFYAVVASTKRRRKVRFLESHLSESPQSSVPYFCYLLALCRSGSKALAMRMMASKRRSSFGINCVQCDIELIAPERSEYRDSGKYVIFGAALNATALSSLSSRFPLTTSRWKIS
jgi:hypothetical protein